MKKPWLAFLLSFVLPGAGLWYVGKFWYGVANLGVVLAIGVLCAFLLPEQWLDEYQRYIAIGCSGGSGGLAQSMATLHNAKLSQFRKPGPDVKS